MVKQHDIAGFTASLLLACSGCKTGGPSGEPEGPVQAIESVATATTPAPTPQEPDGPRETSGAEPAGSITAPPNIRRRTIQTPNGQVTFVEVIDEPASRPAKKDAGAKSRVRRVQTAHPRVVFPSLSPVEIAVDEAVTTESLPDRQASIEPQGIERIIGHSDFLPVYENEGSLEPAKRLPDVLRRAIGAFGYITVGCTGTHIGGGIVLTAGHCIMGGPSDAIIEQGQCPDDFSIRWNYIYKKPTGTGILPAPVSSKKWVESDCVRVEYAEWSTVRDIAVVRFDSPPSISMGFNADAQAPVGTLITLLSFPEAQPLTWTPRCEISVASNVSWMNLDPNSCFTHQCDTLTGSSGAAVIRLDTWEIIGIHDGGRITEKRNGMDYGWNYGTFLLDSKVRSVLTSLLPSRG